MFLWSLLCPSVIFISLWWGLRLRVTAHCGKWVKMLNIKTEVKRFLFLVRIVVVAAVEKVESYNNTAWGSTEQRKREMYWRLLQRNSSYLSCSLTNTSRETLLSLLHSSLNPIFSFISPFQFSLTFLLILQSDCWLKASWVWLNGVNVSSCVCFSVTWPSLFKSPFTQHSFWPIGQQNWLSYTKIHIRNNTFVSPINCIIPLIYESWHICSILKNGYDK